MRSFGFISALGVCAAILLGAGQAQAVVQHWNEVDDADVMPGTAQATHGSLIDPLGSISGRLRDTNDVDLYLIYITDPANFSATCVGLTHRTVGGPLNTRLFLFDPTGHGIYANDDAAAGVVESTLPTGDPSGPVTEGFYLIGIASFSTRPLTDSLEPIFTFPTGASVPGVLAPSSPTAELGGWFGQGVHSGDYTIAFTGARVAYPMPEPVTAVLSALGLGALALRRFRRNEA
jgi:MYXO-CTERM domain-containing protein